MVSIDSVRGLGLSGLIGPIAWIQPLTDLREDPGYPCTSNIAAAIALSFDIL